MDGKCQRLLHSALTFFELSVPSIHIGNPLETIYEKDEELNSIQDLEKGGIHIQINEQVIPNKLISDIDDSDETD